MLPILRRVLVLITIIAFVGGMTLQAMPSAVALGLPTSSQADAACPHMATDHPGTQKPLPARSMDADCVKQMGCIGSPNVPSRSAEMQRRVSYTTVTYWSLTQYRTGLSVEPDLFPPIAS